MENVVKYLIDAAAKYPDRIVLRSTNKAVSFSDFYESVVQTAAHYRQKGIAPGDQAMVFVPMSIDLYRHVLALLYIGAVPVFIDEWVSLKRLKACMQCLNCKALIAPLQLLLLSVFVRTLRNIPIKILAAKLVKSSTVSEAFNANNTHPALITFTTGTTGIPKAAIRTHGNLSAQFAALSKLLNKDLGTSLSTLPIVVLINIGLGRTSILPDAQFKMSRPETVSYLARQIEKQEIHSIIASPSVFKNLSLTKHRFPQVNELVTGGGSVFPDLAASINSAFPNAFSQVVFGGTEAEPVSSIALTRLLNINHQEVLNEGLPVGTVAVETTLQIIPFSEKPVQIMNDGDWKNLQLPNRAVGEIVVTGEHVVAHYLSNEQAFLNNKVTVAGKVWHRTGDIAYRNNQQQLFYFGRGEHTFYLREKPFYPMLLEYYLCKEINADSIAVLQHNEQVYIFTEGKEKWDVLRTVLHQLSLEQAVLRSIPKIPKDKRHQTKIDYDALKKYVG